MNWQPMETAPKDKPILALCNHAADQHWHADSQRLTLYAAHADGMSHVCDGPHVIVWGGEWHDSYEDGGAWLPDWWFQFGSEFEVVANPIGWAPIPEITT